MAGIIITARASNDPGSPEVYYPATASAVGERNLLDVAPLAAFSPPVNTDYISRAVNGAVETFVFKSGGSGGTTLKTVTVTYVDSTLAELVSVAAT